MRIPPRLPSPKLRIFLNCSKPHSAKRFVAVILAIQLVFVTAPVVSVAAAGDAITRSGAAVAGWGEETLSNWLRLTSPQDPESRGVKPQTAEQKDDKLNRLVRLQINPDGLVQLESRESMLFTAVPFDSEGSAIHGLQAEWESSDKRVVFVKKTGAVLAGQPGAATVTARAGALTASVQVIVVRGSDEPFGKKKTDSIRNNLRVRQHPAGSADDAPGRIASRLKRRHHSANQRILSAASPYMFLRDPNDDPLPDSETISLFKPINTVGSPPGKTRGAATAPPPATSGTETNGNKNFTFALPVAGLPGRGLSASLSLVYNSAVWNKSTAPSTGYTWMTYDVDSSWPAAGGRMTLGQIENQGSAGYTLIDAEGTRHALSLTSTSHYDTTDGTFIHYFGGSASGTLYYPDGTIATFGAGGGGYRLYPTQIKDRNGYVHLQANSIPAGVVAGASVTSGQQIGIVGNTGNALGTPPHLHFRVQRNGGIINPEDYLNNPC